jgi:hypothetical protein
LSNRLLRFLLLQVIEIQLQLVIPEQDFHQEYKEWPTTRG